MSHCLASSSTTWPAWAAYCAIPQDVNTLAGFRRWVHSGELPEKLRVHFIGGTLYLDMSEESIQSHVFVKVGIFATLIPLMREEDLGEFYTDGVLLTNKKAKISNNPDGLAALWKTIESGQVRFLLHKGKEREIQGTPDWVMEIVSDSSVAKDTKQLRKAYHKAGISEYWLIDARGEDVKFHILYWRKPRYVVAPIKDGWQRSRVFGRDFRLKRRRNRRGAGPMCSSSNKKNAGLRDPR